MGPPNDTEEECRLRYNSSSQGASPHCPAAWDTLACWPPTPAGARISFPCTALFPHLRPPPDDNATVAVAFRSCGSDGRWSRDGWTNYSQCVVQLDLLLQPSSEGGGSFVSPLVVSLVVLVVSLVSLVCLGVALFVFSAFRSIQCSRIRVHRHLVLSLMLHAGLLILVSAAGLSSDLNALLENTGWLCRSVLSLKSYSSMSSVLWMFVEGILLHASVASFDRYPSPPFALYHAVGWGLPCACVTTWLVLMSLHWGEEGCWRGYGKSPLVWIITGPMMAALLVNALFLINIIRILVTKLRASVAMETKQVRKAARATFLLFPLLGISHLLFCVNPGGGLEPVYMLVNALLQSSQGMFVAVLYCFLNSEVQSALSAAYSRRRSCSFTWRWGTQQRSSRMFTSVPHEPPRPPRQEEESAFDTPPRRTS